MDLHFLLWAWILESGQIIAEVLTTSGMELLAAQHKENAGLLALTRVGSQRVVQISAGFMIFFSIFGKFGAVVASIPPPLTAAFYCLFFAYVGSAGLSFLQLCNLNSFRTIFILRFSIFMGLSVPHYFNAYRLEKGFDPVHTKSIWFNDMINVLFQSEAFVAGFLALFLDVTLHGNDIAIRKDRGVHWWSKFQSAKGDTRSEECHSLPFNLENSITLKFSKEGTFAADPTKKASSSSTTWSVKSWRTKKAVQIPTYPS